MEGQNAGLRVLLVRVVVCGDAATPVPAPALAALLGGWEGRTGTA